MLILTGTLCWHYNVAKLFRYKEKKLIDEENFEANKVLNRATVDSSKF